MNGIDAIETEASMTIHLTDREQQCLTLAAAGLQAKEIARVLRRKVETVNSHLAKVRKKLDARNTTQAVSKAMTLGLLMPPRKK